LADTVTVVLPVEAAMNISALCYNRLRDNDRLIVEFPELPVDMANSTRIGYESFIRQVEEQTEPSGS
jgi:hypothetical protein